MESVRRKVLNELFLAPSVVLPIVAGASAWLISWGIGGHNALNAIGLAGVLGGIGWMTTRILFQLDAITERTRRFIEEKKDREEELRIEQVVERLKRDLDHRPLDFLTLLRESRREFEEIAEQPEMQARSLPLVGQIHQLFWAAIEQLDQSYKLSELSKKLKSGQRHEILARREQMLGDIQVTVDRMAEAVQQFRSLSLREQNSDLRELRDELDLSLKIAHRTEERMRELENSTNQERPQTE